MRYRHSFMASWLVIGLLWPAFVLAQAGAPEFTVTAASMESLPDGTLTARGEVVVLGEGVTVRADSMKYDPGSDTLLLSGNVIMEEDGGGAFKGDSLALDLADLTGGISRGEIIIVPNGFRVKGEDINREGPEEYSIRKGVFTSCPGDCPDWSFTASEIRVRKEGYLQARHAAFRILDIPVFYIPYLLYPVKTQRQTGLLFPELSFSDETGLESKWPVFITLGPHADATLSPSTFSRDDFGIGLEARYLLDWGGGGRVRGFAMTGERPERWYVAADQGAAVTPDVWLRWRWYDTGDPGTAALFGDTFEERYPGVVHRHATLEGDHGLFGYAMQTASLLTEGSVARSEIPGSVLQRDAGVLRFGPAGGSLWRFGLEAEEAHFEGGAVRSLLRPAAALWIPGPWRLAGYVEGGGVMGSGGEGSSRDESWIIRLVEKAAVESKESWGRHRADLTVTAAAAQGAAFGGTIVRDSRDLVEERRIYDARIESVLRASGLHWDLTAGAWRDTELDQALAYGLTRFTYKGIFLEASRNRDADFAMTLPSIASDERNLKGWQVEAGYKSGDVGLTLGRDSAEGFPEILTGAAYFPIAGVGVSGKAIYDMDADTIADERVTLEIPGRCWTLGIERSRTPDRTDWSMQLELGL